MSSGLCEITKSKASFDFAQDALLLVVLVKQPIQSPTVPQALRISGLIAICDQIHRHITEAAQSQSSDLADRTYKRVQEVAAQVEALCEKHNTSPASLPTQSRQAYEWLRFLSDADRFRVHVQTIRQMYILTRANPKLQERQKLGQTIHVELNHNNLLWRTHAKGKLILIAASEGFVGAPTEVLHALITAMTSRSASAQRLIKTYAAGPAYAQIHKDLTSATGHNEGDAGGQHFDLDAVFERVNRDYFNAAMPRPKRLIWSSKLTRRVMGHYQTRTDTVMLSKSLDDARVPPFVVDFVMYHELLHKRLGSKMSNGRRQVHFAEFREAEKLFPSCEQANVFLNAWARQAIAD